MAAGYQEVAGGAPVVLPGPWSSAAVTVVLPTYNEAANLPVVVDALFGLALTGLRMVVVDDNSSDGTGAVAEDLAVRHGRDRMSVVHRPEKQGLGRAYVDGMSRAIRGDAEFVVQMDSDLSHRPEYLPQMLGALLSSNADVVIGSRYIAGASLSQRWPWHRKLLSSFANAYARAFLRPGIRDVTAGFKLWRSAALHDIDLGSVRSKGYSFQVEMSHRAGALSSPCGRRPRCRSRGAGIGPAIARPRSGPRSRPVRNGSPGGELLRQEFQGAPEFEGGHGLGADGADLAAGGFEGLAADQQVGDGHGRGAGDAGLAVDPGDDPGPGLGGDVTGGGEDQVLLPTLQVHDREVVDRDWQARGPGFTAQGDQALGPGGDHAHGQGGVGQKDVLVEAADADHRDFGGHEAAWPVAWPTGWNTGTARSSWSSQPTVTRWPTWTVSGSASISASIRNPSSRSMKPST